MTATILTSSILILAVLALRTILRGRVRAVTLYALWLVCALRLMLPFSIGESRISLENVVPAGADTAILSTETLNAEIASVPVWQETVISQQTVPEGSTEPLPPPVYRQETVRWHISTRDLLTILRWAGTVCVLAAFIVSDTRFAARLRRDSVPDTVRGIPVRRSPALSVPCLYGCTIWLPESLSGDETYYAAVHEQAHLRHADPVWTVLRILLVAVWWFDPLVWIAAFASKQDAELAADESALAILGEDARVPYGRTLLSFAALRPETRDLFSTATPMARRSGLSARIRLLAASPRRSHVLTALALVLTLALTACAFAGPVTEPIADQLDDTLLGTVSPTTAATAGTTRTVQNPVPAEKLSADVREYIDSLTVSEAEAVEIALSRAEFAAEAITGTSVRHQGYDKSSSLIVDLYAAGEGWYTCKVDSQSGAVSDELHGSWSNDVMTRQWRAKQARLEARGQEEAAMLIEQFNHENAALGASLLSEEQAKAIALAYDLLPAEYVRFTRVTYLQDGAEPAYKLYYETVGGVQYEKTILATTGRRTHAGAGYGNWKFVVDALADAGVPEKDATVLLNSFDVADDRNIAVLVFLDKDRNRYDYTIDTVTGEILFKSKSGRQDMVYQQNREAGITLYLISEDGFSGLLAVVKDPSKVQLAVSSKLGEAGQRIGELCEASGAILGVNASAYSDESGKGTGGYPLGCFVSGGEPQGEPAGWQVVGFDEDNRLYVGPYDSIDKLSSPLRDAVEFKPALLMNGEIVVSRDDGWGINPRTVIGQTADGTVLLLVINGRSEESVGCRNFDCAQILSRYGALNACALDEGSSSVMWYDGRVVSRPSSLNKTEGRQLPNAFVVLP